MHNRMLKRASILTGPLRHAKTLRSTGKVATSEAARRHSPGIA
jgi:hypothetical protein